jgi:hypothetical protein
MLGLDSWGERPDQQVREHGVDDVHRRLGRTARRAVGALELRPLLWGQAAAIPVGEGDEALPLTGVAANPEEAFCQDAEVEDAAQRAGDERRRFALLHEGGEVLPHGAVGRDHWLTSLVGSTTGRCW